MTAGTNFRSNGEPHAGNLMARTSGSSRPYFIDCAAIAQALWANAVPQKRYHAEYDNCATVPDGWRWLRSASEHDRPDRVAPVSALVKGSNCQPDEGRGGPSHPPVPPRIVNRRRGR